MSSSSDTYKESIFLFLLAGLKPVRFEPTMVSFILGTACIPLLATFPASYSKTIVSYRNRLSQGYHFKENMLQMWIYFLVA